MTQAITPQRRGRPEDPRITELDLRLIMIVDEHGRITVRGVFYQAVNLKLVEKTENAVDLVGRRLLKLRRTGRIPYSSIADESRIVYGGESGKGSLWEPLLVDRRREPDRLRAESV